MAKTQSQIFYEEQRKIGEVDELFMEFVKDGMTRDELARNIERRPSLWARFKSWLNILPSKVEENLEALHPASAPSAVAEKMLSSPK